MSAGWRRPVEQALAAVGGLVAAADAYGLVLAGAAAVGRRRAGRTPPAGGGLGFLVLIPAHDEEAVLPGTVDGVAAMDYPGALVRVVVVADHCTDATAAVAAAAGAEVLERRGGDRGKGPAIAWALDRLADGDHDAVLFLDADCVPSANLLSAVAGLMASGAQAVQADYVVANPSASWSSALRYASFALVNTARPWGKDVLGLSCGISGSGFALTRAALDRHPWSAFGLTEDTEYHLELLRGGVRVRFCPGAAVRSPMPTSLAAGREQSARWETGKLEMLRRWAPRLLVSGVRRRDLGLLHAAVDGVVPPQSIIAAGALAVTAAGAALRARAVATLGVSGALGQVLYVLVGLWVARAPRAVYRALAYAPVLVAWKVVLYARLLAGRGPRRWERTAR